MTVFGNNSVVQNLFLCLSSPCLCNCQVKLNVCNCQVTLNVSFCQVTQNVCNCWVELTFFQVVYNIPENT